MGFSLHRICHRTKYSVDKRRDLLKGMLVSYANLLIKIAFSYHKTNHYPSPGIIVILTRCNAGSRLPAKSVMASEDHRESSFGHYFYNVDHELSKKMGLFATKGSSPWRAVLILLEISGHGVPWIAGAIYFVLTRSGTQQHFACNVLAALILDLAVVGLLKVMVRRKRPIYNEADMFATVSVDKYSFPSGHSSRAVLLAALFGAFLQNSRSTLLIHVWSVCLAVSRVVLGRHHVSDVLCGILLGWLLFWFMTAVWLSDEACLCVKDFISGRVEVFT